MRYQTHGVLPVLKLGSVFWILLLTGGCSKEKAETVLTGPIELIEHSVSAPRYAPLMGEDNAGSGFHFDLNGRQFIACSLHQFGREMPTTMRHPDLAAPIPIVGRVGKQRDIQILKFESAALSAIKALTYDPHIEIIRGMPVFLYHGDQIYRGYVIQVATKDPVVMVKMKDLYPADRMSGSPVVSGLTGTVIGVVLTASSLENAELVGFEPLRL